MKDAEFQPTEPVEGRRRLRAAVRWGLYPLLLVWVGGCLAYGLARPASLSTVVIIKSGVMVPLLLVLEWLVPYQRRWSMTIRHLLRRDVVFIAMNGPTLALLSYGLVLLSIDVAADRNGPLTGKPLWLQVVMGLLVFEALQYSMHRFMHRGRGPVGHMAWRTHSIHHLPQQLYVVMHAVGHPFNAVIVRLVVQLLPLWVLGYDPEAVFVFSSISALHGTISHLNLDMRAGWLNYVFVGPELHRYHHGSAAYQGVNYAATLSVFDWALGTGCYRPGTPPQSLGLSVDEGYPGQHDPLAAARFPLSVRPVNGTRAPTHSRASISARTRR